MSRIRFAKDKEWTVALKLLQGGDSEYIQFYYNGYGIGLSTGFINHINHDLLINKRKELVRQLITADSENKVYDVLHILDNLNRKSFGKYSSIDDILESERIFAEVKAVPLIKLEDNTFEIDKSRLFIVSPSNCYPEEYNTGETFKLELIEKSVYMTINSSLEEKQIETDNMMIRLLKFIDKINLERNLSWE